MIPFHLICILGEQVVQGCLDFGDKEGCFDMKQMIKMQAEHAFGQAIGNIGDATGIKLRVEEPVGETCICKNDLCNSLTANTSFSKTARTSSLMTIIFVVFLPNLY